MSCTPRDVWALAQRPAEESCADEATLRSAMSRAYYAAHLRVRDLFPEHAGDARERHEGSHEYVIRRARDYAQNKASPLRTEASVIAMRLDHCKRECNFTDYTIGQHLKPSSLPEQMKRVAKILELCDLIEAAHVAAAAATGGMA
ncbi:hypothetical protein QTI66_30310 [Variovorax sp. J22R133]|uniref:hypothetical protein n=1 Tax=Variovorax brevis TaxID=3053503 RepID=UPI002577AB14|nr:hypothetical protein [Variovorax sp. J22R133]MDM0116443.1 hypothetical protein [Variovorax sp. J22R133]